MSGTGDLPEEMPDTVEDQPAAEDMLLDGDVEDELDRGYSPPERWSAAQGYGNTPLEQAEGETFEQRLAQEEPDVGPGADGGSAVPGTDPNAPEVIDLDEQYDPAIDTEVGDRRAGRLVAPDEGAHTDTEKDLVGTDVGIDGAAASAEEAAVHVVGDDEI